MYLQEFLNNSYTGLREGTLKLENDTDEELSVDTFKKLYTELKTHGVIPNKAFKHLTLHLEKASDDLGHTWYNVYASDGITPVKIGLEAITWEQWLGIQVDPAVVDRGLVAACVIAEAMTEFGSSYYEHRKAVAEFSAIMEQQHSADEDSEIVKELH
jgi:hypothetical protein